MNNIALLEIYNAFANGWINCKLYSVKLDTVARKDVTLVSIAINDYP